MYWLHSFRNQKENGTRPPSSGATVASSRRVMKAGPSTPVQATLAMTRDHSPGLELSEEHLGIRDQANTPASESGSV